MKQDNRGFSIVELIVVIGIMAILVSFVTVSLSMLTGAKARECAQKVSSQLSATKTGCMSRFDETMKLYKATDGYYTENSSYTIKNDAGKLLISGTETLKMGSKNVVIQVYLSDGSNVLINESTNITFSYNRATGEQDSILVNNTEKTGVYVNKITFQQGNRTYTINMVPKTGKHSIG